MKLTKFIIAVVGVTGIDANEDETLGTLGSGTRLQFLSSGGTR